MNEDQAMQLAGDVARGAVSGALATLQSFSIADKMAILGLNKKDFAIVRRNPDDPEEPLSWNDWLQYTEVAE